MRSSNYRPPANLGKGFGDWEKHTRGIGAKLLMQMGYEAGKGLGKNLQGRASIVEAHLRKGRGAIGAYGHEGGRPKDKKVDSEEEEEKEFKEQLHQWKKGGEKQKRVKYVYKTADQVLEEGKWRKVSRETDVSSVTSKVKVIDMTGREERVLSGYHAIGASKQMPDGDDVRDDEKDKQRPRFAIPELVHNVNMLMDTCEEDLISADRKLRYHKDRVEVLRVEEEKLSRLVEREKEEIEVLEGVLDMVEKLEMLHEEKRLDLNTAMELFRKMNSRYPEEYRLYELPHIAITIVAPLLKPELSGWSVLDAPFKHKVMFAEWRDILHLDHSTGNDDTDPFYNLVWESWMPSVRTAINLWNTRNPDALIDFLKGWADLIPARIIHNIRDLIVLPRLQSEVNNWDPMSDPVPLHSWLHPWLEVLGSQLEIVYPTIRHKLAAALNKWHPSDKSARLILLPWRDVFDKGSLQGFLLKNIVPKLDTCLSELSINPTRQDMSQWQWFAAWKDFLPSSMMVSMLEKHFFNKWLQVLASWLNHSPDYNEVTKWYQGWKRELSDLPDVLSHASIRAAMNQALEMMNRAVSGGTPMSMQPGAFEAMRYLASRESSHSPSATPPPPSAPPPPPPAPSISNVHIPENFKDLLSQKCAERGILFAPMPGRFHEGKQMYRCGNVVVYIDRSVIFFQRSGMWVHTSLDDLLRNAL